MAVTCLFGEPETGKVYIKDVPTDFKEYGTWRYGVRAAVLAAAPDPLHAMSYLSELDNEDVHFEDLAMHLPIEMTRTDVKLFSAIMHALEGKHVEKHHKRIQARCRFGCGRQALRILDEAHKHEGTSLAIKASSKIVELSCSSFDNLETYLTDFELYRAQMVTSFTSQS